MAILGPFHGAALAQSAQLTILHVNDVYEISPKKGRGGFAPLMTLLEQFLKEKTPEICEQNVRLQAIGRLNELPKKCQKRRSSISLAPPPPAPREWVGAPRTRRRPSQRTT